MGRNGSSVNRTEQREKLLQADDLLHSRLWHLQRKDQLFASLFATAGNDTALGRTHTSIQEGEKDFKKIIDSIERKGIELDQAAGSNDFQNMTTFFKTILENRRFLDNLRSDMGSNGKESMPEKKQFFKLQNQLYEKDKLIADLQNKNTSGDQGAILSIQNELQEKNKQINTLGIEIQNARKEKDAFTKSLAQLGNELKEKNISIGLLENSKVSSNQKVLLGMQNEVTARDKRIRDLEFQLQSKTPEKNTATQSMFKLQNEIIEKDKRIRDLEVRLQNKAPEKNTSTQSMFKLQNDIIEKDKRIRNLEAQALRKAPEKNTSTQEILKLQNELVQKEKVIAALENKNIPAETKTLKTLQSKIVEKDKRIHSLEDQLQSGVASANNSYKAATGETLEDLQQRNTNLRLAYNNTMTQMGVLTKKYNLLKSEVDQLKNQRK